MIADAAQRIERILAQRLEEGRKAGVFPGASASVAIWTSRAWTYIDQTAGALADTPIVAETPIRLMASE